MISRFVTLEPLTKLPRVLDIDDALWLLHREGPLARLTKGCRQIICGNDFLADHFCRWNSNVVVIPTAVNTEVYRPREAAQRDHGVIGWSGTSSGFKYLSDIEDTLAQVLRRHSNWRFRVVSDKKPIFTKLPMSQVDFVQWNPSVEVASIQEMDIGIMPLRNTDWERGKCSFKMLCYMACAVPVVVSNVGMNIEVLRLGHSGFGADTPHDWFDRINELISNPTHANELGRNGREIVERHFSIAVLTPILARVLKNALS
jgi:glycosyltransferase involved in cell wall biosynthesis